MSKEASEERRVAIITGASRGIGAAVALRLAHAGSKLVLSHLRDDDAMRAVVERCEAAGAEVLVRKGEIADPQTAAALCKLALDAFGRIDVLVNNAGVTDERLLLRTSDEQAQRVIDTNIYGVIWLARAVMRPMLRQRSGSIINLSSTLASRPGVGCSVYAGTKGFVESFTKALAAEMGRKGVRVNAVAPGVIETEMSAEVRAKVADKLVERIGSGRVGHVDEVAEVVAFLASDASSYVNGAVIAVDGAFSGGI